MILTEEQLKAEGLSDKAIAKLKKNGDKVAKAENGDYAVKGHIDIICKSIKTLEKLLSY